MNEPHDWNWATMDAVCTLHASFFEKENKEELSSHEGETVQATIVNPGLAIRLAHTRVKSQANALKAGA